MQSEKTGQKVFYSALFSVITEETSPGGKDIWI
jgi:hypothetical protein